MALVADVLVGNPDAVTLGQVIEQAVGRDAADWLLDRKNRRAIPHRMERCGYVPVRNDTAEDGLWVINGRRQAVYARALTSWAFCCNTRRGAPHEQGARRLPRTLLADDTARWKAIFAEGRIKLQ
jgi:hypothetical protein